MKKPEGQSLAGFRVQGLKDLGFRLEYGFTVWGLSLAKPQWGGAKVVGHTAVDLIHPIVQGCNHGFQRCCAKQLRA